MTIGHLDFETRSAADLRRVGLDVYAADPSTDVICAAYAFDHGPVRLWKPLEGEPAPTDLLDHIKRGGEIRAHNASFELAIVNGVCRRDYGWPEMFPEQVVCTMAKSYAMGLPGSLDGCASALGLTEQKDLAGGRVMLTMSKPKEILPDGTIVWEEDPVKLDILYKYCAQDIIVERLADGRMPNLSAYERRVWEMDYAINRRGVKVDVANVKKAIVLVEAEKRRLDAEMQDVSQGNISTCTAVAQIRKYLEFYGVTGDSLDKAAVLEHLATDLPKAARRILELRAEAGKSSTSKFTPMVNRAGVDGRLRGSYQFCGSNTRRWAGRGVQLQNLPRSKIKPSEVEDVIEMLATNV